MLIKNIQLGTPITIISGGINAVRTVISYPSHPNIPNAHITPIPTTNNDINVARNERKNKKKIMDVINVAPSTKSPISSTMF